tara:strand:+ start:90 stop:665 length:576 start_codon:yes stop_codon:yes gene_type:complete
MKYIYLFLLLIFSISCSKPKTVLICGDHVCVNKAEAEQYFEENLTIEVKIIDQKIESEIDLVELNLTDSKNGKREISLSLKDDTNVNLKTLSNQEIINIKENIKIKKKENILAKKNFKKNKDIIKKQNSSKNIEERRTFKENKPIQKKVNKDIKNEVDICTILEKCSIDEISKYLLEQGRNKKYPDITKRQ